MRVSRPDTIGQGEQPVGNAEAPRIRGKALDGFPFLPIGCIVFVAPDKQNIRETETGIAVVESESWGRRRGIVVAYGPGEFMPYLGFVSPSVHYGIELRDLVYARMDCGEEIEVDGVDYLIYRPEDLICRVPKNVAAASRRKLIESLQTGLSHHVELGSEAGEATGMSGMPSLPDRMNATETVEEHVEKLREERGTATKTQVVVPGRAER